MSRALLEGNGLDCASDRARGQVRSILEVKLRGRR